jgi:hypothetical protein
VPIVVSTVVTSEHAWCLSIVTRPTYGETVDMTGPNAAHAELNWSATSDGGCRTRRGGCGCWLEAHAIKDAMMTTKGSIPTAWICRAMTRHDKKRTSQAPLGELPDYSYAHGRMKRRWRAPECRSARHSRTKMKKSTQNCRSHIAIATSGPAATVKKMM